MPYFRLLHICINHRKNVIFGLVCYELREQQAMYIHHIFKIQTVIRCVFNGQAIFLSSTRLIALLQVMKSMKNKSELVLRFLKYIVPYLSSKIKHITWIIIHILNKRHSGDILKIHIVKREKWAYSYYIIRFCITSELYA